MLKPIRLLTAMFVAYPSLSIAADTQTLTFKESKGAAISGKWQNSNGLISRGADGKVVFLFGEIQPSVVCSPLQVCDIELEEGEIVRDVLVGDTVRWKVEPATSGSVDRQSIHLVIKPSEPGLSTSMVVTTSRRTYHIRLRSHPTQYMARIGFSYPDAGVAKLADINARLEAGSTNRGNFERLHFSFAIRGNAPWKPKRVYSDGEKTYIQFPVSISGQDAPVLFVKSGGQNRVVNYRLKQDLMIVDYAIDRAVLISGVGWRQRKVTLTRGG